MGIYWNPGPVGFRQSLNSEIYVDKSGMIAYLNKVINTEMRYVCVSRPRRFGKTMAAKMIAAYYDRSVNQEELFQGLTISREQTFSSHAGKYDVLKINVQEFLSMKGSIADTLKSMTRILCKDLQRIYPEIEQDMPDNLAFTMKQVFFETGRSFVIVIDEWDCIFREFREDKTQQEVYLDFLRSWLKDQSYVGLAYMTGILPIKKYGTHSALNMFAEFSMTGAEELATYVGFTEKEVKDLCARFHMDFTETQAWYDGYRLRATLLPPWHHGIRYCDIEIYSPRSVVSSMLSGQCKGYWNQTETFEALRIYIDMNFDGLKDVVLALMAGGRQEIDVRGFTNDMVTFESYQDVLTLLIHLGYLGYDSETKEVFIPNRELMDEFVTATTRSDWTEIIHSVQASKRLLSATWNGDAEAVARGIEDAHFETSHIQYNNENALSYVLSLAYYAARQYYHIVRELPTGKGFADMVFIPRRKYRDKPAMIVELKWDKSADTAIRQIKEKRYDHTLKDWQGEMLLVGISYDRKTRKHRCLLERR